MPLAAVADQHRTTVGPLGWQGWARLHCLFVAMRAPGATILGMESANRAFQFGCGLSAPAQWTNFDCSPTLRAQKIPLIGGAIRPTGVKFPTNIRVGDVVRGLPLRDESCRLAYCSHVIEHLTYGEVEIALRNVHRYLQPGGVFRLVLPDLAFMVAEYLRSNEEMKCRTFTKGLLMAGTERRHGVRGVLDFWLSNSGHRSHWDYAGLSAELRRAGFASVRPAGFGDSSETMFALVEEPSRWKDSLGIEAVK